MIDAVSITCIYMLTSSVWIRKPYEENNIAQKIVKNSTQESFASHLHCNSVDNRLISFLITRCMNSKFSSSDMRTPPSRKLFYPLASGNGLVNPPCLCNYYEIINKFAHDISALGKHCHIAIKKNHTLMLLKTM